MSSGRGRTGGDGGYRGRDKPRDERIKDILDELSDDGELSRVRADEVMQLVVIDIVEMVLQFSDLTRSDVAEKLHMMADGIDNGDGAE